MNTKETEEWLLAESAKKNSLAETYLQLLKNATPEMRKYWIEQLSVMIEAVNVLSPDSKKTFGRKN